VGQQQGAGRPGLHLAHGAGHLANNLNAAQANHKAALAAVDVARKSLDDTVLARAHFRRGVAARWPSRASAWAWTPG
jgi:hypothetical protein